MTRSDALEQLAVQYHGTPLYDAVIGEIAGFLDDDAVPYDSVDVSNALASIRSELDAIEAAAQALDPTDDAAAEDDAGDE